jgi:hypothetical protein
VLAVEVAPDTAHRYARLAFTRMLAVADRMGDGLLNERPAGEHTNSVAALIVHCCGVCEFWLGHVGLGRESHRDRPAEFVAAATLAELHEMVEGTLAQVHADLLALEAAPASPHTGDRSFLADGDGSDGALVLHVLEELFQHLGHAELSADALGVAPVIS